MVPGRWIYSFNDCCFTVNRQGRSGGLVLYWNLNVSCSILNFSQNHIDAILQDNGQRKWRVTGYYGFSESGGHREAWNFL